MDHEEMKNPQVPIVLLVFHLNLNWHEIMTVLTLRCLSVSIYMHVRISYSTYHNLSFTFDEIAVFDDEENTPILVVPLPQVQFILTAMVDAQ